MQEEKLFAEFPPVSTKEWEDLILKELKGADYQRSLVTNYYQDIQIKPYYRKEDLNGLEYLENTPGKFPFLRAADSKKISTKVVAQVEINDIQNANTKIKDNLLRGVNSLNIKFNDTEISSITFLDLFKDIELKNIEINFEDGDKVQQIVYSFSEYLKSQNIEKTSIQINFSYSPLTYLASTGKTYSGKTEIFENTEETFRLCETIFPGANFCMAAGDIFGDSGANPVMELALALSVGNEYLCKIPDFKINKPSFVKKIYFKLSVGSDYFIEIAKLRAARYLWSEICEKHNIPSGTGKMNLHTVTTNANKAVFDPYVNVLRATTETMSALIGGSNSHFVRPFDNIYNESNEFSERIARNIQIILNNESYFDKITDPAAGSYFIENLTDKIINKAWEIFLDIEKKGGFLEALKAGYIQKMIEENAAKKENANAMQKEFMLGVTRYPNRNEKFGKKLKPKIKDNTNQLQIKPLSPFRISEKFEQIRIRTELSTKTPKVFLLQIGNPTMRKARAGFAANFFSIAGFEIIEPESFEIAEKGALASLNSNAEITVICSSDEEYISIASQIAEILKNKSLTVIAGYPKNYIDELKNFGIFEFIHINSNIIEILTKFQDTVLK